MIALLIDIGNSRIKWRIANIGFGAAEPRWLSNEQAVAVDQRSELAAAFASQAGYAVEAVFFSNVAADTVATVVRDAVTQTWRDAPIRVLRPLARQCDVVNGYRDPARLGPDRWLAMIGARARFPQRSLLVCSFGTATTIDLLVAPDASGFATFVGGLILPGFDSMRASLESSTARLPLADGRAIDFADDTDDAITSGIAVAQSGAVERAWRTARERLDPSLRATLLCVLAGGRATTVEHSLAGMDVVVEVVHDLVLRGIAAVAGETMALAALQPHPATG